jgi:hypothetical protein
MSPIALTYIPKPRRFDQRSAMITPHPSTTVTSSLVEVVFRSSIVCNNQNSRAAIFSHAELSLP